MHTFVIIYKPMKPYARWRSRSSNNNNNNNNLHRTLTLWCTPIRIMQASHYTAMYQIGYDSKRRVIADDRVICLKSGPFRSTISHYTCDNLRLSWGIRRNLSEIVLLVQNVTPGRADTTRCFAYDDLWLPPRRRRRNDIV